MGENIQDRNVRARLRFLPLMPISRCRGVSGAMSGPTTRPIVS
jgi:hypothetical protein